MIVDHRVRAILINNLNQLVLIKCVKEGSLPYWIAPGGGFDASDGSFEKSLEREIKMSIGGTIAILKLLFRLEHQLEEDRYAQQHFFLCRLSDLNGQRQEENSLDEIPLRLRDLHALDIRPAAFKRFLLDNCNGLFEMPDLRLSQ